jgi:hypothetical protein
MVTLNNPINPQNIVDRFKDFVTDTANSSIVWGTNNKPFSEMPDSVFGGTTLGTTITVTGSTIGAVGNEINAANIVNALLTETALYTSIRNLRAILNVTGGGGNTGSYPNPGAIFDATAKSYLDYVTYKQTLGTVNNAGVSAGQTISSTNLETFYTNLQTEYNSQSANTATVQVDVCHSSCHSNCHGSRGRR